MTLTMPELIDTDAACRLRSAKMALDHFATRIEQVGVLDLLYWDDWRDAIAPRFQAGFGNKRQSED